jgi:AcrR family transcriptional regulator
MAPVRDEEVLSASLAATRCLIDSDGRASVAELAEAAGISRRTWHRYFPAKEDLLRPLLRDAAGLALASMRARPHDENVVDSFLAAFATSAGGMFAERTRALTPLVFRSTALSAVMDNESTRTATLLRAIIAERWNRNTDDAHVAALATTLVALSLSSLSDAAATSVAPEVLLAERVGALGLDQVTPPKTAGERRES